MEAYKKVTSYVLLLLFLSASLFFSAIFLSLTTFISSPTHTSYFLSTIFLVIHFFNSKRVAEWLECYRFVHEVDLSKR